MHKLRQLFLLYIRAVQGLIDSSETFLRVGGRCERDTAILMRRNVPTSIID